MTRERIPAEVFAPGEYIAEEIAARNWDERYVRVRLGISPEEFEALISGKRIDLRLAQALGMLFGTSAELWMNLDMAWRRRKL